MKPTEIFIFSMASMVGLPQTMALDSAGKSLQEQEENTRGLSMGVLKL